MGDGTVCLTKKSLTGACGMSGSTLYAVKSVMPHDRSTSRSEKACPERKLAGETTTRNAASATIAGVLETFKSRSPPMKLVAAVATACLGHSVLNATPVSRNSASSAMDSKDIPTLLAVSVKGKTRRQDITRIAHTSTRCKVNSQQACGASHP